MKRTLAGILSLLPLVACADATGLSDLDLQVTATTEGLRIINESGVHVFYQAVDPEVLAQWAGPSATTECSDPDCPHVAPGSVILVSWPQVLGWREQTRWVEVSWWRVVPSGDGRWRAVGRDVRSQEVSVP